MRKHKESRHFLPMTVLGVCLAAGILYLLVRLAAGAFTEERQYQEIVSLGKLPYDAELLKKVEKLEGLVSFTPVLELPVELKLGDYTMNAVLQAVDLSELHMKGKAPKEIALGNTPVLLVGKNVLSGMTDANGRAISRAKLKKFWETSDGRLLYHLTEEEETQEPAASDTGDTEIHWMDCYAKARLTFPADGIYIAYDQGRRLVEGSSLNCTKGLLTVQGKENFEKASAAFAALKK